jgi:hypothetical protein
VCVCVCVCVFNLLRTEVAKTQQSRATLLRGSPGMESSVITSNTEVYHSSRDIYVSAMEQRSSAIIWDPHNSLNKTNLITESDNAENTWKERMHRQTGQTLPYV